MGNPLEQLKILAEDWEKEAPKLANEYKYQMNTAMNRFLQVPIDERGAKALGERFELASNQASDMAIIGALMASVKAPGGAEMMMQGSANREKATKDAIDYYSAFRVYNDPKTSSDKKQAAALQIKSLIESPQAMQMGVALLNAAQKSAETLVAIEQTKKANPYLELYYKGMDTDKSKTGGDGYKAMIDGLTLLGSMTGNKDYETKDDLKAAAQTLASFLQTSFSMPQNPLKSSTQFGNKIKI